ncbi:MAG: hypothetical protein WB778_06840 [Thermoplasmata archaeon]
MYRTLRLCSSRGAFEAIPDPPLRLDLAEARERLAANGTEVVDARVMLIIRLDHEVTVSRDGRILVKTRDKAAANRIFRQVVRILDLPAASTS